ncbi:holo-[acyl-carrier protein] synthase [Frondihabitans sp. PhB188]|uniref:holo-ACP synthase n=1 Tax=Frondihabitans sp. PhB188 TaxID=2485200 RepID=UPI000F9598F6|nr:holo-ACP synthase [Frondihabitans sp. PhB188]ROQ37437.1 holo-[acyl-carrier protein] synthase [Frondihabitans sp. PhB188]
MAIVGIGVDVVDVGRFERSLERTPALRARLFTPTELVREGEPRRIESLAARFAAKEAFIKAVGGSTGISWHDMVVGADDQRAPSLLLSGGAAVLAVSRSVTRVHLSLSHDAGIATAFVVAESDS